MLIDWFTVVAQVLNFVVLVWLLKRFLYRPVLDAIDAREARIASQLADAAEREARAEEQQAAFQRKDEAFERERAVLWQQAVADAEAERCRLLERARQQAEAAQAGSREALRQEALRLSQSVADRTRQEVFAIARKTLADLSSAGLERAMAEAFIARLRVLAEPDRSNLAAALATPGARATVRSAFELPVELQSAICTALAATFPVTTPVTFDTASGLVGGLELRVGGQNLGWNIDRYLRSLESTVEGLLLPGGGDGPAGMVPAAATP